MFATGILYNERRLSSPDAEPVSPVNLINTEPQDEDTIPMALDEEGRQDEHEQPPPQSELQPKLEPEPQPQPQPRRSARIKAKSKLQGTVPPKVKTPAKSTSRKRAVRKK